MSSSVDARIQQAKVGVTRYDLGDYLNSDSLKDKVRDALGNKKQNVEDTKLRAAACDLVYTEMSSEVNRAADLTVASANYAKSNRVTINRATVILIRELVYALAAGCA